VKSALDPRPQDFLVHPTRFWSGWSDLEQPVGFLDLDSCPREPLPEEVQRVRWPPFPLVGLGDSAHPLAPMLDAIVEPPVSAEALVRSIRRAPKAAAVAVQLLRSLEGLSVRSALSLESVCYGMLQGSAEHAAWLAARPRTDAVAPGRLMVERRGMLLCLTLDRPQARNAIDRALRDALFEAFTLASLDCDLHSIRLRALGSSFSVGGDLHEFGTTRDPATAHLIRSRTLPAVVMAGCTTILDIHVQGACVGAGLEIAALAGRLTADSRAWFQLPELAMGLIPGAGGCVSVPRRVGRQRASLMILSGRRINATTALRWGLIDAIDDAPTEPQ
jgi:enoyl-CoA hydratase/carnithine racemase